ncbi:hypothetical protein [Candidatus Cardinium sp. TP]|uniref:hypothetical protein n=1 Tax=Candidatus Cardinium sp. TP TaxID=2961955 RepID=UPI0021AEBCE8|nr:hypothetical protein [Candidatus Cardinium sp. TP]MDN5246965.1 hypothetical protein [Candidatus Cardinium sp.]
MGHKQKTIEDFIQKVQQLKAASLTVSHGCNQLIKDYNQTLNSLNNDTTSPMPSMDDKATDSGYESEDSYDTIPYSSFNSSQKKASFTYPLLLQRNRYAQTYSEPWDKLNHKSRQTEPTHEEPTQIVNTRVYL